ncbi:MAG: winged helix-turn-helix domain-containing protein [Desulfobacterales bacterium]
MTEQHPSVFVAAVLLLRVIINGIADVFNLNEDERRELLSSGKQQIFDIRVGWATTDLKRQG